MRELIEEIWLPIPNYINLYWISNLGNVKCKNKQLKQRTNKKGYLKVRLYKNNKCKTFSIHRLVAINFIPNPDNLPQVNHKDGNKLNNTITNLQWCNNSENQLHAYKLGLQPSRHGENNSRSTLTNKDVEELKYLYNLGIRLSEVSNILGIGLSVARNIIYGNTWNGNTSQIIKRDDRKSKTKNSINKTFITTLKKKSKYSPIFIIQTDQSTNTETIYRSINNASIITKIPRKSIEYAINHKNISRGFSWKKAELNLNQMINFI